MTAEMVAKSITPTWLFSIHSIALLLLLIFFVDVAFFYSALLPYMGTDTLLLPIYVFIFELPHIIASLLTFADRSYVQFYKKHFLFGVPLLLLIVGILYYLNPQLTFLLYIITTIYHMTRQQTGIASIIAKTKGWWFNFWTASLIIATAVVLTLVLMPFLFTTTQAWWLSLTALFFVVLSLVAATVYVCQAKNNIGRLFIIATSIVFLTSYFFILVGYIFFAFFTLRFVHDITAFTFYVVHDHNRNMIAMKNSFYAMFRKIRLPFLVIVPLVSVVIALLIRIGVKESSIAVATMVLLGFTHYYVEAVMWKRGSPHRQQISFSN